jgi:hypothetical protein
MSLISRSLVVCLLPMLMSVSSLGCCKKPPEVLEKIKQDVPQDSNMLKTEDDSQLRSIVQNDGVSTCIARDGPEAGKTIVAIPKAFDESYQRNRLATLRLLLDIVNRGTPEDVLTAAAIATALEDSASAGLLYVYCAARQVDEVDLATGQSIRTRFAAWLAKRLAVDVQKESPH